MRTKDDVDDLFDESDDTDDNLIDEIDAPVFEGTRLAYIKTIDLEEARALGVIIPSEIRLPQGVKLYALHAADGTTLGITDTWASAYSAAVQNNFVPLSVH
ncbi:MAG TPA: DUF1150 family protein [Tepidisphaeraceae bacterium]|jgi:hypothetical protein|nr:DUF1150 family protein [Tepidisphaeraceae bacterium]